MEYVTGLCTGGKYLGNTLGDVARSKLGCNECVGLVLSDGSFEGDMDELVDGIKELKES